MEERGRGTFVRHWEEGRSAVRSPGCCTASDADIIVRERRNKRRICRSAFLLVWSLHSLRCTIDKATQRPLQSPKCLLRFPPISGGDQEFSL